MHKNQSVVLEVYALLDVNPANQGEKSTKPKLIYLSCMTAPQRGEHQESKQPQGGGA